MNWPLVIGGIILMALGVFNLARLWYFNKKEIAAGKPQKQAVAIAEATKDKK